MSTLAKRFEPHQVETDTYQRWEEAAIGRAEPNSGPKSDKPPFSISMPPPNVTGSLHMGHALQYTLPDILCRFKRANGFDVLWQPGVDHAGIAAHMVVEKQLATEGKHRFTLADTREESRKLFDEKMWKLMAESGGIHRDSVTGHIDPRGVGRITTQMRRLGILPDWSRQRFTMDDGLSRTVRQVFVRLFEQGLITRAKRLVNWDPVMQTAVSDVEVEQKTVNGQLSYIRYDGDGFSITVATTRPETMFGDVAIAVHPDDERYSALIGKSVTNPANGVVIPIIADAYVNREKGSGAVKITPGHDANDHEVAVRYNKANTDGHQLQLPFLSIFDKHAKLDDPLGSTRWVPEYYQGLDRFVARKKLLTELESRGFLEKTEAIQHAVPHNSRGGVVLEPMLSDQWYLDVSEMAKRALQAATDQPLAADDDNHTQMIPPQWLNNFRPWLQEIQPWCISRQLWWGHQIPVRCLKFQMQSMGREQAKRIDEELKKIIAQLGKNIYMTSYYSEETINRWEELDKKYLRFQQPNNFPIAIPYEIYCAHIDADERKKQVDEIVRSIDKILLSEGPSGNYQPHKINNEDHSDPQLPGVILLNNFDDPDVLDTWFSAALWPFSTLDWDLDKPADLQGDPFASRYYPTDLMITGFDILFFWVARMMMMGLKFTNKVPFRQVYLTPLVRDATGMKMSKSKGNVIDPLDVIDEFGADALRFTLAALSSQGRDIKLSEQRIEGYRNFMTKLWNAARFSEMNGCWGQGGATNPLDNLPTDLQLEISHWLLAKLKDCASAVGDALSSYRFDWAADALYHFVWNDLCDWYLEFAKQWLQSEHPDQQAAKQETQAVTRYVLATTLRLLEPIAPFITQDLWQQLSGSPKLLCQQDWPTLDGVRVNQELAGAATMLFTIAARAREKMAADKLGKDDGFVLVIPQSQVQAEILTAHHHFATYRPSLSRLAAWIGGSYAQTTHDGLGYVVVSMNATQTATQTNHDSLISPENRAKILASLQRDQALYNGRLQKLEKELANEGFRLNAPEEFAKKSAELQEVRLVLSAIEQELQPLESAMA
ncbi:MAG: valine--tRNA ligase [Alphaproteobacteria bacterium]|nr:valine--tRNA ligase [Alphaproteobacteria bacterium]